MAYYCSERCRARTAAAHAPVCATVSAALFKAYEAEVAAGRGGIRLLVELQTQYYYGTGTPVDKVKAFELCLKAATLGDVGSMYNFARRFQLGEGVAVDIAGAKKWARLAGEHGCAEAWHNLGCMYLAEKKHADAVACFSKSAHAPTPVRHSFIALGDACSRGEGLPRNHAEAARFYEAACAGAPTDSAPFFDGFSRLSSLSQKGVRAAYEAMCRVEPQDARAVRRRARFKARYKSIEFVDGVGLCCVDFEPGEPGYEQATAPGSDLEDDDDDGAP